MVLLQSSVAVSLCVLGLSLSLVSGQLDGIRLAPRDSAAGDLTSRILSFDDFGIGTGSPPALYCFIDPGGHNWYDPNGAPLWVDHGNPANRVGWNPSVNEILLLGVGYGTTNSDRGIFLNRGANYYALDGLWCCGPNGGRNLNTNRCVTFTPCPTLPVLTNGGITYNRDTNVATYSCNSGYRLEGNGGGTIRTCSGTTTSAGTWSGSELYCVVGCPDLPSSEIPTDGAVSYDSGTTNARPVGVRATFTCDAGFFFVYNTGYLYRFCESDFTWSGSTPSCEIVCSDLSVPASSAIAYSGVSANSADDPTSPVGGQANARPVGIVATYSCPDSQFTLVGSATRTCQSDRSWSGSEPSCQRWCSDLMTKNGFITYSTSGLLNKRRPPGTVATYSCEAGYALTGSLVRRTCEDSGSWTGGEAPVCADACSLGYFLADLSDGDTFCVPCPAKSYSNGGGNICPCFAGFYRTDLEGPHSLCSAPPSRCSGLVVVEGRTRANTITVLWERPQITGRDDFYYNIFYSEDNQTFTRHNERPYYKGDRLVDYSLSGLRALTNYTIRVSVENGVSDQEGSQDRSCQITASTADTRTSAPPLVVGLCTAVTWVAPSSVYGRIIGYDIRFSSGGEQSVVSKGSGELFHIVRNELTTTDNVKVEVRASTVAGDGNWSQPVSLGCGD